MLAVHRNQPSSGTKQIAPVKEMRVIKRALKTSAKLNDHAPQNNQSQAQPGGQRNGLSQDIFPKQDTCQGKETNINAQELGKIPIDGIHQQAIASERYAPQQQPKRTASPESAPYD